jgi:hypothetical protein
MIPTFGMGARGAAVSRLRRDATRAVAYPRHFILLASATATLGMTDRWHEGQGAVATLGLYGGLHATLIVAALREQHAPRRKVGFILIAAGLAMLCVLIGLSLGLRLGAVLGVGAPAVILTLSSGLGAASYGFLIHRFWSRDLSVRKQCWITLCCGAATLAALPSGVYLHTMGVGWFAMVWWWSFSIALWYHDGGPDMRRVLTELRQVR